MSANPLRFLSPLLLTALLAAQELAPDRKDGAGHVSADNIKAWVSTLASKEFEGRGTGQDGFRKAAEWMRDQYKALGLEPAGDDGSFFQKVPWSATKIDAAKTSLAFRRGDKSVTVPFERLGGSASKSFEAKGSAVLVTADKPEAVAALELKDKVVVLLSSNDDMRARMGMLAAFQEKGAACVITAQRVAVTNRLQGRPGARGNRAVQGARMAPAMATFGGEDLESLMKLCGLSLDKLSGAMTELPQVEAQLSITISETDAPAYNV